MMYHELYLNNLRSGSTQKLTSTADANEGIHVLSQQTVLCTKSHPFNDVVRKVLCCHAHYIPFKLREDQQLPVLEQSLT